MREAREIMAELAASGLSGDQLALVMELSASLAVEARPIVDHSAQRRRARDRTYQAERRRQKSADSDDASPPKERDQNPQPSETEVSKGNKRARKSVVVQVPEWMPAEQWLAFVAMRKAMRNVPFTDAAAMGVIREIEKFRAEGHCPAKLLERAVTRGYRTVFPAEETRASGLRLPADKPWTAAELRRGIAHAEDNDDPERAAEYKRRLAELTSQARDPPERRRGGVVSIGQAALRATG